MRRARTAAAGDAAVLSWDKGNLRWTSCSVLILPPYVTRGHPEGAGPPRAPREDWHESTHEHRPHGRGAGALGNRASGASRRGATSRAPSPCEWDPGLVGELSAGLAPRVVVTGTNGKTTTTGLLADALGTDGREVVCNRAGNNMESGIAAALVLAKAGEKDDGARGLL